ncbi:MAG: RNA polymerase sigma factor, partial [Planctomycetota bacterium]
ALLRRKLRELTEVEQDVIALKFAFRSTGGLSNGEVAALVGVTPGHLGVLLHRALGKLRAAMTKGVGNGVH